MTTRSASGLLLTALAVAVATGVAAVEPERPDVWAIALGTPVSAMPRAFADFACGTRGGPPSTQLAGPQAFSRCAPEEDGLHEIYFRFDDELEYWAKANNLGIQIDRLSGTKVFNFPVVLSVLVDDAGIIRGLRMVSDPRDRSAQREEAYYLGTFLMNRYGAEGWACSDLPRGEGEAPVFGIYVKRHCEKDSDGLHLALDLRHLRKPGQTALDPVTGRPTEGLFESETRFEMRLAG